MRALIGIASLLAVSALIAGCQQKSDASVPSGAQANAPAPRFSDGLIRFDRAPGEKGYWDTPSVSGLVEDGAKVEIDAAGKLKNIADASKVAPFQPWALGLYQYRQQSDLKDDPM